MTRRLLLSLAIVAACLAAPAQAAKRALIIGINDYVTLEPGDKLRGAVNDANAIAEALTTLYGYGSEDIRKLIDQEASREAILSSFQSWLVDGTRAGDDVFFFFAGHGYQVPDQDGDEEDGLDEALAAVDVAMADGVPVRNMILDDEIGRLVRQIPDRRITMVIDSCHSGTVTRSLSATPVPGARKLPAAAAPKPAPPGVLKAVQGEEAGFADGGGSMTLWTAVSPTQIALEDSKGNPRHGVFTSRFIRGLRDKAADANGDGVVTHSEMIGYLQRELELYCKKAMCSDGLTPSLETAEANLRAPVALTPAGTAPAIPASATVPAASPAAGTPLQSAATAVLANDNPAGVSVEILPGNTVRLGQAVRFRVKSQTGGHLVVLDVNAANKLSQIFPNEFSERQAKGSQIAAGRPLTIPDATYGFEFTASEPVGGGLVIALVIEDPVPLKDILGAHLDLEPVNAPEDYLARIAHRLRRPWTGEDATRRIKWSVTSQKYRIAP